MVEFFVRDLLYLPEPLADELMAELGHMTGLEDPCIPAVGTLEVTCMSLPSVALDAVLHVTINRWSGKSWIAVTHTFAIEHP